MLLVILGIGVFVLGFVCGWKSGSVHALRAGARYVAGLTDDEFLRVAEQIKRKVS
jgi:hypothetical protein